MRPLGEQQRRIPGWTEAREEEIGAQGILKGYL